jgi:hypothetical protein
MNRVDGKDLFVSMTFPSAEVRDSTAAPTIPVTIAASVAHTFRKIVARFIARRAGVGWG